MPRAAPVTMAAFPASRPVPGVGCGFVAGFVACFDRLGGRQAIQRVSQRAYELRNAFAGGGGDGVKLDPARCAKFAQLVEARAIRGRVQLGGHDDRRFLGKLFAECSQLAFDDFVIAHRVAVGGVARVNQMRDEAHALDVF